MDRIVITEYTNPAHSAGAVQGGPLSPSDTDQDRSRLLRDFQKPGRSPVYGVNGAVATSHPLASASALDVLKRGGHAMDAAIAASAVLAVVEPAMTGVGGDNFTIVAPGDGGPVRAYNGSGRAPANLDPEAIRAQHRTMPQYGVHAITVPGAVEAWCRLHVEFGRLPLDELMAPAVEFAREGYVVHPRVAHDWRAEVDKLSKDRNAAAAMLCDGDAPAVGSVHRQPKLAKTLERIGREGPAGFYSGPVAEDMVAYLRGIGGAHSLQDFASAQGEFVEPIQTEYRGFQLLECPPNGQGIVPLLMLNMISGDDLAGLDPLGVERIHLFLEAAKLAYGDRDALVADPRMVEVPVARMLSRAHAEAHRRRIDPAKAGPTPEPSLSAGEDTTYLSVVDRDRNAVSFINSLYKAFGTGKMAPESGVMFHNRGFGFRLDPAHPNALAPGKRPLHTLIPGMLLQQGRAVMPFGVMGGDFQGFGQAWMLTNMLDFGMDIQEAQDLARVFGYAGEVDLERGVPDRVASVLADLGHRLTVAPNPIGGSQGIFIDNRAGVLSAGSDPRKDGCALAY